MLRFTAKVIALLSIIILSACGGGSADSYDDYYAEAYIDWSGSVNGTFVVDATDDVFEFEITTGYLHFGNTTYTTTHIRRNVNMEWARTKKEKDKNKGRSRS